MTLDAHSSNREFRAPITRSGLYRGWWMVWLAAAGMVATMPGRTHGLSIITERLVADPAVGIDHSGLADINLFATLLGALFAPACGPFIDSHGSRAALTIISGLLGLVCLCMCRLEGAAAFFVAIMLARGLGQSALSVGSLTLVGKWFSARVGSAMGLYSFLLTIGFMLAFGLAFLGKEADWRIVWGTMGAAVLFGFAPLALLFVRDRPTDDEWAIEMAANPAVDVGQPSSTLAQALATPHFWVFALASAMFLLINSAVTLFQESILLDRGFSQDAFYILGATVPLVGLATNLATGFLAQRMSMSRLMAAAMTALALALFALPFLSNWPELWAYAIAMGVSGGMVTVLFFMAWGKLYGPLHLGKIQGVAQSLTVLASAVGPKMLTETRERTGSDTVLFLASGGMALVLAVAALSLPRTPVHSHSSAVTERREIG